MASRRKPLIWSGVKVKVAAFESVVDVGADAVAPEAAAATGCSCCGWAAFFFFGMSFDSCCCEAVSLSRLLLPFAGNVLSVADVGSDVDGTRGGFCCWRFLCSVLLSACCWSKRGILTNLKETGGTRNA